MYQPSTSTLGSRKSMPSYKKVAKGARVDESLFGETTSAKILSGKHVVSGRNSTVSDPPAANATMQNAAYRTGVASSGGRAAQFAESKVPEAMGLLIGEDELYRIKQSTVITSVEDIRREREEAERARRERQAVAEARKERIKSMEATRVAHLPLSQLQQEEKEEKERRRAMAEQMRGDAQDDMKRMDTIYNFAIVTAIRERQKAERPAREAQEAMVERMKDLKAELEALEAKKRTDDIEREKRKKREEYRVLVLQQLESARARQAEQRAKYAAEDAARLAKLKAEIEEEKQRKAEIARRKEALRAETLALNEAALQAKAERVAAERAAEAQAAAEMIERDNREKAKLDEAERVRKEKERLASIAAGLVQTYQQDNSRKEELAMQRAWDEGRRRDRAKELERLRKEAQTRKELEEARVRLLEEKQLRMAEMIAAEKDEFVRAQAVQAEWLAEERRVEEERVRANAEHLRSLQVQVESHQRTLKEQRVAEIAEEDARRAELTSHMEQLRALRDAKIAQLKALGVDPKFTVELMKYDPWKETQKKEMVSAKDRKR